METSHILAITCLAGPVWRIARRSVTGGVKLPNLDGVCNELLNPSTVRLGAMRVERNHSPPIWNNQVWRVIVEQVASWESSQDCLWHGRRRRRAGEDAAQSSRPHTHTRARAQSLPNICRLNPINANAKPKWRLRRHNEKFSGKVRLIISCKFSIMQVIRGDRTVEGMTAATEHER